MLHFQQHVRPVTQLIAMLKNFETSNRFRAFSTEVYPARAMLPPDPDAPPSVLNQPRRSTEQPEPIRVFQLEYLFKPEFAGLNMFMDREVLGFLCHIQRLLEWILFGYDDVMKGDLMAKLEADGFQIVEQEFDDPRLSVRPVLKTKQGMILLGKMDEQYYQGSFQYLHERRQ